MKWVKNQMKYSIIMLKRVVHQQSKNNENIYIFIFLSLNFIPVL